MSLLSWLRFGQSVALKTDDKGSQLRIPPIIYDENVKPIGVDAALQISTVWRSIELIAKTIATLPLVTYTNKDGVREQDKNSILHDVFVERPNSRQTTTEFWTAILLNYLLRGNGYAELYRNGRGEVYSLEPRAADQVEFELVDGGSDLYHYTVGTKTRIIPAENMLHIKEMTGGYIGMSRLEFMAQTLSEATSAQSAAAVMFANGGKPSGALMIDKLLTQEQLEAVKTAFQKMAYDSKNRLFALPADMKYQQINLTPQDIELLSTRQFTIQEIGRWFGVPAVLLNQTEGTTTLGSSTSEIIDGFYKTTIRQIIVNIEKSVRMRVLTPKQRQINTVEFNMDALLRASLSDRMEIYAKAVQNGIKSRNECRKLENDKPFTGGDVYTAQSNLLPIDMIGKANANNSQSQITETLQ